MSVAPEELRGFFFFFLVAVLQTGLAALFNTNINSVTKSNCLCAASPQRSKVAADMDVRELHASDLLHWPTSDMKSFAWWRKRTMSSSLLPTCSLGCGTPLTPCNELYQHLVIKQQVLLSWKPTTKLSPTSVGVVSLYLISKSMAGLDKWNTECSAAKGPVFNNNHLLLFFSCLQ